MADDATQGVPTPLPAAPENPTVATVELTPPVAPAAVSAPLSTDLPAPAADNIAPATVTAPVEPEPDPIVAPVSVEPAVQNTSETTSPVTNSAASLPDSTKQAFASQEFHDAVEKEILGFLAIADIEHPGRRRAAMIALNIGEEGIAKRLQLAEAFLLLQDYLGSTYGAPNLVDDAKAGTAKIGSMKKWLGM